MAALKQKMETCQMYGSDYHSSTGSIKNFNPRNSHTISDFMVLFLSRTVNLVVFLTFLLLVQISLSK